MPNSVNEYFLKSLNLPKMSCNDVEALDRAFDDFTHNKQSIEKLCDLMGGNPVATLRILQRASYCIECPRHDVARAAADVALNDYIIIHQNDTLNGTIALELIQLALYSANYQVGHFDVPGIKVVFEPENMNSPANQQARTLFARLLPVLDIEPAVILCQLLAHTAALQYGELANNFLNQSTSKAVLAAQHIPPARPAAAKPANNRRFSVQALLQHCLPH